MILLALWQVRMQPAVPSLPELQIRMVQLVGGGDNRAGWVDPRQVPQVVPASDSPEVLEESPVEAPVVDEQPVPVKEPPVTQEVKEIPAEVSPVEEPALEVPVEEPQAPPEEALPEESIIEEKTPVSETQPAEAAAAQPDSAATQEVAQHLPPAAISEQRPGPFGPGHDVRTEAGSATGIGNWLRRVKSIVLRNYRYPARGSGRFCVYGFEVDAKGTISGLKLKQHSGDALLDHAAELALRSSKLPPLPPAAELDRLAVSFKFSD